MDDPDHAGTGAGCLWEVIHGNSGFFEVTKAIHNGLQGATSRSRRRDWKTYEDVNAKNFDRLRPILEEADIVFIHDPQPANLPPPVHRRKGKWIWRAHIDISRPFRPVWKVLRTMRRTVRRQHLFDGASSPSRFPTRSSSCRRASTP